MPRRRGVTLIDLVVTVLIMGISASIAVPKFSSALKAYQIEAAARRVVGLVNFAGEQARVTSQPVTVAFDIVANTVTLTGVENPDHPGQVWTIAMSEIADDVDIVSAVFGGEPNVTLAVDGRPDAAGSVLLSVGSLQTTVVVSVSTGRATVQ